MANSVNNTNVPRVERVDIVINEETLKNIISYISDHPEADVNSPRFPGNKTLLHILVDRETV